MAVACAGAWETGLGGPFTEAELAAADQLVQLSGSGGGGDEAASSEPSSPRSVNTCTGAAAWEEEEDQQEVVAGLGLGMELLDRRARKRYRLLSDLYAVTRPVDGAADAGNARKRKRSRHEQGADVDAERMMRYGDQCF